MKTPILNAIGVPISALCAGIGLAVGDSNVLFINIIGLILNAIIVARTINWGWI